jgi:hypothetical protein
MKQTCCSELVHVKAAVRVMVLLLLLLQLLLLLLLLAVLWLCSRDCSRAV